MGVFVCDPGIYFFRTLITFRNVSYKHRHTHTYTHQDQSPIYNTPIYYIHFPTAAAAALSTPQTIERDPLRVVVRIGPVPVDAEVALAVGAERVREPADLLLLEVVAVAGPQRPVLVGAGRGDALPHVAAAVAAAVAAVLAGSPWVLRDHHGLRDQLLEGGDFVDDGVPFVGGVEAVSVVGHDCWSGRVC